MKMKLLLKENRLICSMRMLLCVLLCGAYTYDLSAQGTAGNSITFDETNCTMLFSDLNTSQSVKQNYSCYLRHNQAPIQVLNANPIGNSYTIAPLQNASGTGNGFFANSSLANNMAFCSDGSGRVQFYHLNRAIGAGSPYKYICIAVVAPRGYRFTEYWMSIDGSQGTNGANGCSIMRYTYDEGTTYQFTECPDESMSLTGDTEQIFSHTLSNAKNILYFRVEAAEATKQLCVTMNQMRLKYVIDDPFEVSIPNDEAGTSIHTGYIDLGELTDHTSYGEYYFNKTKVTDLEEVKVVAEDASASISLSDGKLNLSKGGTYWIESPAKFRILGATLSFGMGEGSTTTTWEPTTTLTSGQKYKISDGNDNYLTLSSNGTGLTNTTDQSSATVWTITSNGSGYTILSESGRYLSYSSGLTTSTSAFTWSYDTTNRYFSYYYSTLGRTYYLRYNNSSWSANRNNSTSLTFYYEQTSGSGEEEYTATLYGTSATEAVGTADITLSNRSATLSASGLNNDGIKFSVSGPATLTLDLEMIPLDPNLQTMIFGHKQKDGTTMSGDFISASVSNFQFNNGNTIVIPLAPEEGGNGDNHIIAFRGAYNENRTSWYDGSGSGVRVSNYYLVDSEYERSGSTSNPPNDKEDADRAGTVQVKFSNIETLSANGGYLTETEFSKTDAQYQDITLADNGDPETIYIYSADHPVYMLMTEAGKNLNTHTAYTFYDATVKTIDIVEDPVITVTPIYTSTLKGENVKVAAYNASTGKNVVVAKDSELDTQHVFYGVKVSTTGSYGYLSTTEIVNAIKEEFSKEEYSGKVYSDDLMRTILYIDMSGLHSVSGSSDSWNEMLLGTADNCLLFMPSDFGISQEMLGGGIVAGGEAGVAVTDIIVNDQQPFFTPWSFYTSTHVAHYHRTKVNGKELPKNTTLVLPFSVLLSSNGYLRTTGDNVDEKVQFFNLTTELSTPEDGIEGEVFNVGTSAITSGRATAFTPYHVYTEDQTEETAYVIDVAGATFPVTPLPGAAAFTNDATGMVGYGSLNGMAIPKSENVFYFTKDYFWNSRTLSSDNVMLLPYRAYYKTTDAYINSINRFGVDFSTGTVTSLTELFDESTVGGIYDMTGRKISTDNINSLPRGLYIVNGKKIFIK